MLPSENIKLRTFVPQERLTALRIGSALQVMVDGTKGAFDAKVSFISPRAEYTPPVIYNRENRSKFVFLVEARFDRATAARLHPGQPVDVRIVSAP